MKDKTTRLMNEIQVLLDKNGISNKEREILTLAYKSLDNGDYFNKCVHELKNQLSTLALKQELSAETTQFFTELTRREPSSGPASIFNSFIR